MASTYAELHAEVEELQSSGVGMGGPVVQKTIQRCNAAASSCLAQAQDGGSAADITHAKQVRSTAGRGVRSRG
jgi:hypothetical protein